MTNNQPNYGYNQQPGPYPAPQQPAPAKKKRTGLKVAAGIIGGFLLVFVLIGALAGGGSTGTDAASVRPTATQSGAPVTQPKSTPAPKPTEAATEGTGCDLNASDEEYAKCLDEWAKGETVPPTKPTKAAPTMTASQEQAVATAEEYLQVQSFSRAGLIRQLSSAYGSGFPAADAKFAVDHIKVDWNEQAAKAAREYLQVQHFSRSGLIHQLESKYGSGFTHAQAVYGVTKAGL